MLVEESEKESLKKSNPKWRTHVVTQKRVNDCPQKYPPTIEKHK